MSHGTRQDDTVALC